VNQPTVLLQNGRQREFAWRQKAAAAFHETALDAILNEPLYRVATGGICVVSNERRTIALAIRNR
jgi:hypothetical protein